MPIFTSDGADPCLAASSNLGGKKRDYDGRIGPSPPLGLSLPESDARLSELEPEKGDVHTWENAARQTVHTAKIL